jgi:myo-inositol 2-dehydrogenase / D-chiro-inositol 1-dehydrogenase
VIRFCVVGTGRMGRLHATNIAEHPRAKLRFTFDADQASAQALGSHLGAEVARSLEEAVEHDEVDAVVVAVPATAHAEVIVAAARSHKAIFCEKPVAARTEDAIAAAKEAEHASVPNFVGFMKRFDPGFQSLLEAVREGVIGSVELSLITNRDPKITILDLLRSTHETAPYALLRESTVHDFDLQLAILGPDIREVYAAGSALVSPQIAALDEIDTAMVTLRTASGALGHINNSWRAVYGYDQRIEVMGSEGMLESRNRPVTTNVLYSSSGAHRPPLFSGPDGTNDFFMFKYEQAYKHELDYFITCLETGESMSPSLADGVRAQLLVEAAIESLVEKRPMVLQA